MAPRKTASKAGAKKRVSVAKAIDIGATDAGIFAGTMADASVQHMPDAEQYWLLYKKHPWVRSCVRIKANAVAAEGYDIVPVDGEKLDENDPDAKLIHEYFRNAFIGRANTFRKWRKATATDLDVFGCAFTRKKNAPVQVDGATQKKALFLERLDPRLITPKLNAERTEIEFFMLKRSTYNYDGVIVDAGASDASASDAINGERIQPDEIIFFSLDEGGDAVLGSPSPLEAVDLTCAMDLNVRHFRNSLFRNGAQAGNILVNQDGNEEDIRAAEKTLMAMKVGARNAFKNWILTGQWQVHSLQSSGKQELDFIDGSVLVRDEICAVYGVPPSKLINTDGSLGQAGKSEDDETFEQEAVLPLEENIYETLTAEILQNEFGIDDLMLVPKRRNKIHPERMVTAMNGVKAGWTGNEARDFVGLPKSDAEGMDEPLFLGATAGNVGTDEPVDPAQAQTDELAQTSQDNNDAKDQVAKRKARPFVRTRHARLGYLNISTE